MNGPIDGRILSLFAQFGPPTTGITCASGVRTWRVRGAVLSKTLASSKSEILERISLVLRAPVDRCGVAPGERCERGRPKHHNRLGPVHEQPKSDVPAVLWNSQRCVLVDCGGRNQHDGDPEQSDRGHDLLPGGDSD